jgi:hypothetical protein
LSGNCEPKSEKRGVGRLEFFGGLGGTLLAQLLLFYGRFVAMEQQVASHDREITEIKQLVVEEFRLLRQEMKAR